MKRHPLITIAIPTYNRADCYLGEALRSALSQTYSNVEIIVSDNCSSDGTDNLVKSLASERVRYFRQTQNIGANNNFNFCLSEARGDYFLLLQDDDMIDRDFVETCVGAVDYEKDVGIVRSGTRIIDARGSVLREYPNMVEGDGIGELIQAWYEERTALYLCSTLFNTCGLKEAGGFGSPKALFQDVVAELRLAARLGRVDIPQIKASFRKHPDEMTFSAKVDDWCEDSIFLLGLMLDLVDADGERVKNQGLRFFSKLNYNRASSIKSPLERFASYLRVYRRFDYRYPLVQWLVRRSPPYRWLRALGRKFTI